MIFAKQYSLCNDDLFSCFNTTTESDAQQNEKYFSYPIKLWTTDKHQSSSKIYLAWCYTHCLKKPHWCSTITSMHINRFWKFLANMLLREYAIEWWCVNPPLLTNVTALPGKTWTVKIGSLQSHCIPKTTLLWLAISSTLINQFYK